MRAGTSARVSAESAIASAAARQHPRHCQAHPRSRKDDSELLAGHQTRGVIVRLSISSNAYNMSAGESAVCQQFVLVGVATHLVQGPSEERVCLNPLPCLSIITHQICPRSYGDVLSAMLDTLKVNIQPCIHALYTCALELPGVRRVRMVMLMMTF